MLYLIPLARGPHATAHYALCTGFMALGMMVPGMWSGWLQAQLGYHFFLCGLCWRRFPVFWSRMKIPLEPEFRPQNIRCLKP
jgi:PAT family beta-lactamase induction signal transducer AmpG